MDNNRTKILEFIADAHRVGKHCSIRELMTLTGLSHWALYYHLDILHDKGLITWDRGKERTMRLNKAAIVREKSGTWIGIVEKK